MYRVMFVYTGKVRDVRQLLREMRTRLEKSVR
jgi:hypothetical protein